MRRLLAVILLIAILSGGVSDAWAVQGSPTGWGWCTICGRDRGPGHDFTHGYGSGGGGGYSTYNDPFIQTMTPMLQSVFDQIGQDFANMLFGDPAEEARQQALRERERQRKEQEDREAARRAVELARQRQIAHDKLIKQLKLFGTIGGGLKLKSINGGELDWDGRKTGGLQLKSINDVSSDVVDLRPAGTSFFGVGGGAGAPKKTLAHSDPSVVDLRNFRRASFLAQAANNAPPQDRQFLREEAVRAADGDTSFIAKPPNGAPATENQEKFLAFQEANQRYRRAQQALVGSKGRLTMAEHRAGVAAEAVKRTQSDLDELVAKGGDPTAVALKKKLFEEAQKALTLSQRELQTAKQEAEIAEDVHVLLGWGRRQQVIELGAGQWEQLSDEEKASLSKLQRVYRIGGDVPLPDLPGRIARAEAGRRALKQIERYEETMNRYPAARQEVLAIQLDRVRHKAEMMDYYDQVINARTGDRMEAMGELRNLNARANDTMKKIYSESIGTIENAIGDFRSASNVILKDPAFQGADDILNLNDKLSSAKSIMSDISASRTLIETGQLDFDAKSKLIERANNLAADITKDFELLEKKYPKLGKQIVGRAAFWVKAGHGIARTTNHTMDILQFHQDTVFASNDLGEWARHGQKIQDMYKRQVDGFLKERAGLDYMLTGIRRTN